LSFFEVIRSLGIGTSAEVFEVICPITGQRCALKKIPCVKGYSDSLFMTECKFLSSIKSEGVIKLINTFRDKKNLYILTELGVMDLFTKIEKNGYLSEKETKEIIRNLLTTIHELHQSNIIHRDLKPENIIFMKERSNFPKLIDFGNGVQVEDEEIYDEFVGTECYLSPERWRKHYGWELKASEIWATGVMTFEMLTATRCFRSTSEQSMEERIQNADIVYPNRFKPSRLARHFIQCLLTVESDCRPTAQFALMHPWLIASEDPQVIQEATQQWNTYVTEDTHV